MAARYAASPTYASVDGTIASQESENRLLELVDDDVMDLGLDTDSDEEVPIFNLEQHLAEFPESEEMLRPIPIRKLHDYWVLFCELDYDCSNQVSASELHECFVMIGIPVDSVRVACRLLARAWRRLTLLAAALASVCCATVHRMN